MVENWVNGKNINKEKNLPIYSILQRLIEEDFFVFNAKKAFNFLSKMFI